MQCDKAEIASRFAYRIADSLDARSIELAILVKQHRSSKHEVAAVPEIAGFDVFGGFRRVRLLHEFGDCANLAGSRIRWQHVQP